MLKIQVQTKEILDELYENSAFSIEGLSDTDENIQALLDWIKKFTNIKQENVYIIKGSFMNSSYNLTGNNRYPDDNCNIICIKLCNIEDVNKIVIPRFQIGGRWFDDIVDNNSRRENEKSKNNI